MKTVKVVRVSADLLRFENPLILKETSTTRRCFYGELGRDASGEWNARGTLFVERKLGNSWAADVGPTLKGLKAGEMAKLEIHTDELKKFLIGLQLLADAAKLEGIEFQSSDLVIAKRDEVVHVVDRDRKLIIQQLINSDRGSEFWEALRDADPEMVRRLADAEIQRSREAALAQFELELRSEQWTELQWEAFFLRNTWIFGVGLRFPSLSLLQNQANYGGVRFGGKGVQKGEFLMRTGGIERFTVLVEIKRPESRIFLQNSRERPYRNGVPGFGGEFANAISQVQVNAHTWELEGSKRYGDLEKLADARIHTVSPRTLLIFGHSRELENDFDRRKAFELFRSSLSAPEIMTFDEVFERARFIVQETAT